ncbi:MAG: type IV pilus assembly protein PilM [Phycisphaerales bacterium]
MAKAKAAWGIEIGHAAVKAVRLEREGSDVRVADFVVIPHPKVLTSPDVNVEDMLRMSLGQLMSQRPMEGSTVVVSVPGNEGLARFVPLPPLPDKAIEQTVLFEAKQQIPFPLEEVEWDRHLFRAPDSPDVEVGIFAILKEKVAQRLGLYKELGLRPNALTLGPVAVYNAMVFDRDLDRPNQPVVAFLDIGTRATDLIVVKDGRCWIRTFPIGGHHFTEAISGAVDGIPYGKADRLKAETATHQHAKKLMHVMRPVFDDLLREVQRSVSHYDSLNPDRPITQVFGLGNTFRIPGLRKFLSDQLNIEIRRLEEFQKVKVEGSAASEFAANSMNLGTAIGLALQGVGLGAVNINLSPVGDLREQVWMKKAKWFIAAAVLVCAASATLFVPLEGSVAADRPGAVTRVLNEGKQHLSSFDSAKGEADVGAQANNVVYLLEDREVWPWLVADVNAAIATAGTQEALLSTFDPAAPPVPYEQWNTVELADLSGRYKLAQGTPAKRSIDVTMRLVVPRDARGAKEFVQKSVLDWLNKNADRPAAPYVIVIPSTGIVPEFTAVNATASQSSGGGTGPSGPATDEPTDTGEPQDGGAGAVSGRNKATEGSLTTGGGGFLGGSSGGGGAVGDGGAGAGGKSADDRARDRKAARAAIKTSAAEPVDIDGDAAIPAAPNPYVGKPATAVTIKFTVELRAPVGREIAPAAAAGEEGAPQ